MTSRAESKKPEHALARLMESACITLLSSLFGLTHHLCCYSSLMHALLDYIALCSNHLLDSLVFIYKLQNSIQEILKLNVLAVLLWSVQDK